jgi:hypothetical protein
MVVTGESLQLPSFEILASFLRLAGFVSAGTGSLTVNNFCGLQQENSESFSDL